MTRILSSLMLLCLLGNWQVAAAGHWMEAVEQAVSADEGTRIAAIATLRQEGPESLKPLFAWRERLKREITTPRQDRAPRDESALQEKLDRVEAAIDQISGQRYACHSRLYWYTDLDQAKAEAAKQNKPILSLRMLGNLTEDFSCANSRFFRTTLYANAEVSEVLREKFILHWKSVRPVPRVTIDFGDGRKLERTLTGNSIHYVMAADGQIIDALPGLYGPSAFLTQLTTSLNVLDRVAGLDNGERVRLLVAHHKEQLQLLDQSWANDYQAATQLLANTSISNARAALAPVAQQPSQQAQAAEPPAAGKAVRVAVTKSVVEMKLVKAVVPVEAANPVNVTDERLWQVIAQLHAAEAKLDPASLQLIRSQNPIAAQAGRLSMTKARVEDPLVRLVRTLESSIAVDTVRNEYQLHRQTHSWLATNPRAEVEQFNEQVYAQLFLTPSTDPWLGLAPADSYTALPNAGVAKQP